MTRDQGMQPKRGRAADASLYAGYVSTLGGGSPLSRTVDPKDKGSAREAGSEGGVERM
jgi:hypothetical protein